MKQITFKVEGMHCGMCESHVMDRIRKVLPKATKVKADHRKGIASFVLEDGIDYRPAMDAISKEGYHASDPKVEEYQKKGLFSLFGK